MGRISFDQQGKLVGVDGEVVNEYSDETNERTVVDRKLKRSLDLDFLKEQFIEKGNEVGNILERKYWNLQSGNEKLDPLKFSNGKTQEEVVKEIVGLVNQGSKIIFLEGACGTGKSAIALNIARILGKASIIVPVKALQRQYEEDYMGNMYLLKDGLKKMSIAMITGRENHDSLFFEGKSCADPSLPENIKITEKNYSKLVEFYKDNPLIKNKIEPDVNKLKRISVAPANPYWSPIMPAEFEANLLDGSRRYKYLGADRREYIFYHRKSGCSYYDQYLSYVKADVIIYNSAKYKAEMSLGRKPLTEVEIIDEADEFLDSLFQQEEINLTRLRSSLKTIFPDSLLARENLDKITELLDLEEKNKKALGVDENKVYHIGETKLREILRLFVSNSELEAEIAIDELNYSNLALEISRNFAGSLEDVYLTYRRDEDGNLFVKLVSTNLSGKIKDLMNKSKALVFMSGTLHSPLVLEKIFGIRDFKIVKAETSNFGNIEIIRTGKEFDCKYSNFTSGKYSREDYLKALEACFENDVKPSLVHVFAFQDLPSDGEKYNLNLRNLISHEQLSIMQNEDRTGRSVSLFKSGKTERLFSTKCSRGVDFPGDICKSIIFSKYPNPNVSDTFWKILQRTHPDTFWEFYKDKARREFLQRIYRALRFNDDHVYVLSPDIRVSEAIWKFQRGE